jgi:hypothetical protein
MSLLRSEIRSRNASSACNAARRCSSNGIVRSSDLVGRPGKATLSCGNLLSLADEATHCGAAQSRSLTG